MKTILKVVMQEGQHLPLVLEEKKGTLHLKISNLLVVNVQPDVILSIEHFPANGVVEVTVEGALPPFEGALVESNRLVIMDLTNL